MHLIFSTSIDCTRNRITRFKELSQLQTTYMRSTNSPLSLSITAEKAIAILIALTYILTSAVILSPRVLGKSLTEEEIIEISRKSPLVKEAFTFPRGYQVSLEIEHWNTAYIKSIKEEYSYTGDKNPYKFLPDEHGVWKLLWYISSSSLLQFIDDLTGQIIGEEGPLTFG